MMMNQLAIQRKIWTKRFAYFALFACMAFALSSPALAATNPSIGADAESKVMERYLGQNDLDPRPDESFSFSKGWGGGWIKPSDEQV